MPTLGIEEKSYACGLISNCAGKRAQKYKLSIAYGMYDEGRAIFHRNIEIIDKLMYMGYRK